MPSEADTIFALASGGGRAGVAVIRVSGPFAREGMARFVGQMPEMRRASLRSFVGRDGSVIDEGLVISFAEGESFTGEPSVEFQGHGSPAVMSRLISELSAVDGFRSAKPGEFTRRALEAGRMDLTQVEALGHLIEAETEAQRKLAMSVYQGGLRTSLDGVRQFLMRALAFCEASIDFADEEVPEDLTAEVAAALHNGRLELKKQVDGSGAAQRIANGFEVVILGPPNVGKSSLMNAIAGDDVAIVTPIAGTTRDVLETRTQLAGQLVTFVDTAGLRETSDIVEQEGVRRGRARAARADLRVFLSETGNFDEDELRKSGDLNVVTKGDLTGDMTAISTKTGEGVSDLLSTISKLVEETASGASFMVTARQRYLSNEALGDLDAAHRLILTQGDLELVSEEIRGALHKLEMVIGQVSVEDILGEIFSSFCIGK